MTATTPDEALDPDGAGPDVVPPGESAVDTARPSFDELYGSAYVPMVRLASLLVDTLDDAEQVVQDAFVAMYRRYDVIQNPGGYLRTSVVNGCRKVLRRRRLIRRRPLERVEHDDLVFNHVVDQIRRLPPEHRVLIGLRYDQQMTDSEIADQLGMPIGTVKSRLHRAIRTLRKEAS